MKLLNKNTNATPDTATLNFKLWCIITAIFRALSSKMLSNFPPKTVATHFLTTTDARGSLSPIPATQLAFLKITCVLAELADQLADEKGNAPSKSRSMPAVEAHGGDLGKWLTMKRQTGIEDLRDSGAIEPEVAAYCLDLNSKKFPHLISLPDRPNPRKTTKPTAQKKAEGWIQTLEKLNCPWAHDAADSLRYFQKNGKPTEPATGSSSKAA